MRAAEAFLVPEDRELWAKARVLRRKYWGQDVFLRGIVEFSSHCRQHCLYCGLRADDTPPPVKEKSRDSAQNSAGRRLEVQGRPRYRMSVEAVFACAAEVAALDFGTVVLQAGEDPALDNLDPAAAFGAFALARLIRKIKKELGLAVTLSLGERSADLYALWREAGADRYLLKLETPDEALYAALRPGRRLAERLETLRLLADLGYETGTGYIVGLPGERPGSLSKGFALVKSLQTDMLSVGPFTPHPATPLGRAPACSVREALRVLALARIAVPSAHIPVTSALGLHGDEVRKAALEVGNVLMPSLTPENVRESYAIYPGKNKQGSAPFERAAAFRPMLEAAGFTLPPGPGGAWRLRQ